MSGFSSMDFFDIKQGFSRGGYQDNTRQIPHASAGQVGEGKVDGQAGLPSSRPSQSPMSDFVSFSERMTSELTVMRRLAIEQRNFRNDLESRLLSFVRIEPTMEEIRQSARFAASLIWDIIKKERRGDKDDQEIATNLLALLMKIHSDYTFEHSQRVCQWTLEMAEELGIEDQQVLEDLEKTAFFKDIGMLGDAILQEDAETRGMMGYFLRQSRSAIMECGNLHDIGKMQIPLSIINKTAPLNEEEFAIIKRHPLIGVEIVKPFPPLYGAIPGIRHHHEKYDGTGYPDGLSSEAIPLVARIITITDTFDAMTEDRPYRKGLSYNDALNELLRLSGKQFDPHLVPAFIKTLLKRGEISPETLDLAYNIDQILEE